MDAPVQVTFRLRTRLGRDDGQVTWDAARRELRGSGLGAEMLREEMEEARRSGRLSTPAGPIVVADPYTDLGGLTDCVGRYWQIPRELEPHMVRRRARARRKSDLPIVY